MLSTGALVQQLSALCPTVCPWKRERCASLSERGVLSFACICPHLPFPLLPLAPPVLSCSFSSLSFYFPLSASCLFSFFSLATSTPAFPSLQIHTPSPFFTPFLSSFPLSPSSLSSPSFPVSSLRLSPRDLFSLLVPSVIRLWPCQSRCGRAMVGQTPRTTTRRPSMRASPTSSRLSRYSL